MKETLGTVESLDLQLVVKYKLATMRAVLYLYIYGKEIKPYRVYGCTYIDKLKLRKSCATKTVKYVH